MNPTTFLMYVFFPLNVDCDQLGSFEPQNLSPDQVEELHDDIERYLSLEDSDINIDFWTVR